jgi:predicted nucleotidyltransferase
MSPLITENREAIEALCRRFGVRRLEVFGSVATGTDRPGESDVDFLVEFVESPPPNAADAYFGLKWGLEELLGRPVDLVAGKLRNPYFRRSVEQSKVLVYAA